jgi:hypothetical protein
MFPPGIISATCAEHEKRNDREKAFVAAAGAAGTPDPTSSWGFQPLSLDHSAAPGGSTQVSLEKSSIRIAESAYCRPGAGLH